MVWGGVRKENSTRPTGLTGYVMAGNGFGASADSSEWAGHAGLGVPSFKYSWHAAA